MTGIRVIDAPTGKTMYLFPTKAAADRDAVILARGELGRWSVEPHTSELGWLITDNATGALFDAQGLVQ